MDLRHSAMDESKHRLMPHPWCGVTSARSLKLRATRLDAH